MTTQQNDAISAIKSYVATLSDAARNEFAQKAGIDLSSINIMTYDKAEGLCKALNLKYNNSESVWNLYNKGKAQYEAATQRYDRAEAAYYMFKKQETQAKTKYNTLLSQAQAELGDDKKLTTTQKEVIASKAGYTTEVITNTKDAEISMNIAQDARFNAVNTQRRGLMFGGLA